jgi:hypothetical protein
MQQSEQFVLLLSYQSIIDLPACHGFLKRRTHQAVQLFILLRRVRAICG